VYGNIKEEYQTVLNVPAQPRAAAFNGQPIDCQDDNTKKPRRVWVTVLSGTITDGRHKVKLQHSDNAGGPWTDTGDEFGPIDNTSPQDALLGQFVHKRKKQFIRIVHEVTAAGTAALGALVQVGRDAAVIDVEEVLRQCMFAVGVGAQMNIQAGALEGVCNKVREEWDAALRKPTDNSHPGNPGRDRWNYVKYFLLACSEAVGQKAAELAKADGSIAIQREHLRKAFNKVSDGNTAVAGAGEYCTNWPP